MKSRKSHKKDKKIPKWYYLILITIPFLFVFLLEVVLVSLEFGNSFSTFTKISDKFPEHKFFNPKLPIKYFGNSNLTPSVIADGFKISKSEKTFRIFALGGSTTAGFPYPPNGSFPRLLKNKLRSAFPHVDFEIINLGISAVNSVTINDIIDDVLEESPDIILFYAGHNEYYGALGPASNLTGFNNLFLTQLTLNLKNFRIVQLVDHFIKTTFSFFSSNSNSEETLMSKMAGEKLVPLNSDLYESGVNQFRENLNLILKKCKEANVKVMVSTLASNLYQQPLCKFSGCDSLSADFDSLIFKENKNINNELLQIKEKDNLRFRAPEIFNEIILESTETYDFEVIDVKKIFENESRNGVIGYNLMLDHLHPNKRGNEIIASSIFNVIKGNQKLKKIAEAIKITPQLTSFPIKTFTDLDSIFAHYRIEKLLNDFPFSQKREKLKLLKLNSTYLDSLVYNVFSGKLSWEDAHLKLAEKYFSKKNYLRFAEEINVLIEDKPIDKFPYLTAIKKLEKTDQTQFLKYYLHRYNRVYPDLFSSLKLADIYFKENEFNKAIYFYQNCLNYSKDPRIYFNLSTIFYYKKNIPNALFNIEKCLEIDDDYPNASRIYNSLKNISSSRN